MSQEEVKSEEIKQEEVNSAETEGISEEKKEQERTVLSDSELEAALKGAEQPAEKPAEPTVEEKLAAMRDSYLRALAENENYRKRVAREMQDIRESTRMSTIGEVVGIYDLLQMAMKATETATDTATIKQGLSMTFAQFKHTLQNMNVEVVDALGAKFDPQLHEAISMVPNDEIPEGQVVQQWQVGFKVGSKLLRPARVVVSSGPAKAAEAPAADGEEKK